MLFCWSLKFNGFLGVYLLYLILICSYFNDSIFMTQELTFFSLLVRLLNFLKNLEIIYKYVTIIAVKIRLVSFHVAIEEKHLFLNF